MEHLLPKEWFLGNTKLVFVFKKDTRGAAFSADPEKQEAVKSSLIQQSTITPQSSMKRAANHSPQLATDVTQPV